jgi:hypothetical protein
MERVTGFRVRDCADWRALQIHRALEIATAGAVSTERTMLLLRPPASVCKNFSRTAPVSGAGKPAPQTRVRLTEPRIALTAAEERQSVQEAPCAEEIGARRGSNKGLE